LEFFFQAVFPENTYGVDSGGDPKEIPKLTFEEFKVCSLIAFLYLFVWKIFFCRPWIQIEQS
jgi:hypothetical protein